MFLGELIHFYFVPDEIIFPENVRLIFGAHDCDAGIRVYSLSSNQTDSQGAISFAQDCSCYKSP